MGFGWDQHDWTDPRWPRREDLDEFFPTTPVIFSRIDGHASWLNTEALRRLNLLLSHESGVLIDDDKVSADLRLPNFSEEQKIRFVDRGLQIFSEAGFQAIRDMSGDQHQWQILRKIQLPVRVHQNWTVESISHAEEVLPQVLLARVQETVLLKTLGFKIYLDGSLGSQGAWLSQPYPGGSSAGHCLWKREDLLFVMQMCWEHSLPIAVHALGDAAAHEAAVVAQTLKAKGVRGALHLEHAQVLRDETIALLRTLDEVHAHMQPCHYLSDRRWLKNTLGGLAKCVFRWRDLQEAGVQVHFGSDSPIETSSLELNLQALAVAEQDGIPRPSREESCFFIEE